MASNAKKPIRILAFACVAAFTLWLVFSLIGAKYPRVTPDRSGFESSSSTPTSIGHPTTVAAGSSHLDSQPALSCPDSVAEQASQGTLKGWIENLNAFAFDLFGRLPRGENTAVSPFSIAVALALAREGAAGVTGEEIDMAVRFGTRPPGRLAEHFESMLCVLSRPGEENASTVKVASAVWSKPPLRPAYAEIIRSRYGAGAFRMDFSSDSSRQRINRWVANATDGIVEEILQPSQINLQTRLALINSLYFKAAWEERFDSNYTALGKFRLVDGTVRVVPFMRRTGSYFYARAQTVQALEIPYAKRSLSLFLFLPLEGQQWDSSEAEAAGLLRNWGRRSRRTQVALELPRIHLRSRPDLKPVLVAMGVRKAFSTDADFQRMTAEGLLIDKVVHEAHIDWDEAGTRAAAGTALMAKLKGRPREIQPFRADHPFIFAIRDNKTKLILFAGRVMAP